jgi:hypothetical protein
LLTSASGNFRFPVIWTFLRNGRSWPTPAHHRTLPARSNQRHAVAFDYIEDRILAQPEPAADFPIRLAFANEL